MDGWTDGIDGLMDLMGIVLHCCHLVHAYARMRVLKHA